MICHLTYAPMSKNNFYILLSMIRKINCKCDKFIINNMHNYPIFGNVYTFKIFHLEYKTLTMIRSMLILSGLSRVTALRVLLQYISAESEV